MLTAARMQASVPDCVFAVHVGAAGAGKVKYSPDGKLLAITSNSRRSIIDSQTGYEVCDFANNKERTTGLCFSPNGKWLAYADGSTIHVKDMDGQEINRIDISEDGKVNMLGQVAFFPRLDGVVATCANGVCVYFRNGKRVTFYPAESMVHGVAVATDGEAIFATESNGQINKWVIADAKANVKVKAHGTRISKSKLSPDGRFLITHGRGKNESNGEYELKVWSTDTMELVQAIPIGNHVTDFAVDGKSEYLLVAKSTGEAIAFSFEDFSVVKAWEMKRGISTADISPDGKNVCFGLSKSVTTIDTNTHRDFVTGKYRTRRNGKPIPYKTIKGQSVSPGAVLVLESHLGDELVASDSN